MIYEQTPFNVEQASEYGVVVNIDDPLKQGRVQFQPASLAGITDMSKLPWIKVISSTNSQQSSNDGGTINSPHSYKQGDQIMANRPTASGADWTVGYSGHPGTVGDFAENSSGTTSDANYNWNGWKALHPTGKRTTDQATYPSNPSYSNPGQIQFQSNYKHVRDRAHSKLENSQFKQNAQRLHQKAQHIGNSVDRNKVTKAIQTKDPKGQAEATQNLQVPQMLDKLRDSLNQIPSMNGFKSNADNGMMNGLQSMIGSMMGQFLGMINMAQQAGQDMNNHNSNANTANQPYMTTFYMDSNNNIIQSGPSAVPGDGPFPVVDNPNGALGTPVVLYDTAPNDTAGHTSNNITVAT